MKSLIISTILFLLNASPLPTVNGQQPLIKTVDESRSDTQGLDKRAVFPMMKSPFPSELFPSELFPSGLFPSESITNNARHLTSALPAHSLANNVQTNALSENAGLAKDNSMQVLSETQQKILEIFKNQQLSISFEEALELAIQDGHSFLWAYRFHDPSKYKYSLFQDWLEMEDSRDKTELKDKMILNPKLRSLLNWKGGYDSTPDNFRRAVIERNPDMIEYFIARGFKSDAYGGYLNLAVEKGYLDICKVLIKNRFQPHEYDLLCAIRDDRFDIVEYLVVELGFEPKDWSFRRAIKNSKVDIFKVLATKLREIFS